MTTYINNILEISKNDTNGKKFEEYIIRNNILSSDSQALKMYQGTDTNNLNFLSAEDINHTLTLLEYGECSSYAKENKFSSDLSGYEYKESLAELDTLFEESSYSFHQNSKVYKGVEDSICFYNILDIGNMEVGDKIHFPGFLSTSASPSRAKDFIRTSGFFLIISGLNNAKCIIPKNSTVLNSATKGKPEQEILINRGSTLLITEIIQDGTIKCTVEKS